MNDPITNKSALGDLDLLRRFEPILRFTRGERFFPLEVEPYVRSCSLWVQRPDEPPQELVPVGHLTLDQLAHSYPQQFGSRLYLRLTEPISIDQLTAYARHRLSDENSFHAGHGRLARVGYGSRIVDALFSISLLARGRVPGSVANAAAIAYQRMMESGAHYVYHGRVVRQNRWIVLQYWFFYAFNNWRSGFYGANDHEGDWEMCTIYLSENEATDDVQPEWVAYASHDYFGDDLRRRWDDPEVQKQGEHPVIFVGAGSHACYYQAGEYLTELELKFLRPITRVLDRLQGFWRRQLRQYGGGDNRSRDNANIFRIPFVDYARGDGVVIGPGQPIAWATPQLIDPAAPWINLYRGLWGLYARDPFAGEDAPAGPMFNRDGSVRLAWYDPLGWAGLDKVTPPDEEQRRVAAEQRALRSEQEQLSEKIDERAGQLQGLGARAAAMRDQPHLYKLYLETQTRIAQLSQETKALRGQLAASQSLGDALYYYGQQLQSGVRGPLRAHIHRAHEPADAATLASNRLSEVWAAISVGLMMLVLVGLFYFARQYLIFGLSATIALFAFVEASVRRSLTRLVTSINVGLSLVAALIIFYEFFWQIVVTSVLVAGSYILWDNLRELRR